MYAKCKICERMWNISTLQKIPKHGYICPWCDNLMRRSMRNIPKKKKRAKIKKRIRFLKRSMVYIVPTAVSLIFFGYLSDMLRAIRGSAELGSEWIAIPLMWVWVYALTRFAVGDAY